MVINMCVVSNVLKIGDILVVCLVNRNVFIRVVVVVICNRILVDFMIDSCFGINKVNKVSINFVVC